MREKAAARVDHKPMTHSPCNVEKTRKLTFRGSIMHGSAEHKLLARWLELGLSNRKVFQQCAEMERAVGLPSSYVLQAIRLDNAVTCRCCDSRFYPSRNSSATEGIYCNWNCYRQFRSANKNEFNRNGSRQHAVAEINADEDATPLIDHHLLCADGTRLTIALRGSVEVWLEAFNAWRKRSGLSLYTVDINEHY